MRLVVMRRNAEQDSPVGQPHPVLQPEPNMKPRTRYGILDDFGEVIRLVLDKPSSHYKYITERIKSAPAVDWNNFEHALF